ncbi:MAG: hypothetical protein WC516_07180 [Patescibacteria group bacterium]|jgi:hypothetical protein
MSDIILVNRGNEQKVIVEEKEKWVYQVLFALGVAEEILVELSNREVVDFLNTVGIEIFDGLGEASIKIWKNEKLVAEWKAPKLILKKEKDEYYYEIHLNEWALPFQMARKGEK